MRNVSIAMNEAVGTVGVVGPSEYPLLGFFTMVLRLIAAGNTVVAVPSESYPLITGDLYQVFETSDLPGGVVNIVAGRATELLKGLAEHDDLDGIWCYGDSEMCASAKGLFVGNLKKVLTKEGTHIEFFIIPPSQSRWDPAH